MSRFEVNIKDSILKQPKRRYIAPESLGFQFYIDFAKCDAKNSETTEYLRTIIPTEKTIVAANAVMIWTVICKELDLKLYSPKESVVDYITNHKTPYGLQKKEILRGATNG